MNDPSACLLTKTAKDKNNNKQYYLNISTVDSNLKIIQHTNAKQRSKATCRIPDEIIARPNSKNIQNTCNNTPLRQEQSAEYQACLPVDHL